MSISTNTQQVNESSMLKKDNRYTEEKFTKIFYWTDYLLSFRTTKNSNFKFIPGQFARIGLTDKHGKIVWRPYSMSNANYENELEFYSIVVPDGEFTQILKTINVGDSILIDKTNYGLLTTDRFAGGKHLWLLSTGTGIAPYISILYNKNIYSQYEKIILVHCVRHKNELVYQDTIHKLLTTEEFQNLTHNKLVYQPVLTAENAAKELPGALQGRLTNLLLTQELENHLNINITISDSRIMICGNPQMVEQTRVILLNRGLTLSRRNELGNLAVENMW